MAVSGDLKRVKAVILADMIGQYNLEDSRESDSTKWLTDLVWKTAERLGYKNIFIFPREHHIATTISRFSLAVFPPSTSSTSTITSTPDTGTRRRTRSIKSVRGASRSSAT